MNESIKEISMRLKELREMLEVPVSEMAALTGETEESYLEKENGETDFSITFLKKCADRLGIDVIELLSGDKPNLKSYCVVRKGTGLKVTRRKDLRYEHLAYKFIGKKFEPYLVTAPYYPEQQDAPVEMNSHDGHEFDYILSGTLRVFFENKEKILSEGDAIYFDSSKPHGMYAIGGEECRFLTILVK